MRLRRLLPLPLLPLLLTPAAARAQAAAPSPSPTPAAVVSPQNQKLNDELYEAVRKGDAVAVKAALDKGADVNARFRYGATALFKAAERGHTDVVKLLVERGADVNVRDTFYGANALYWALDKQHVEVVRALLAKSEAGMAGDVLSAGARSGNAALVRVALDQGGIKPEAMTAALLSASANAERAEIAEMLRKAGAQPPLEVDAATLQSYAGRYKPEQGGEIVFSVRDGRLYAAPGGQPFAMFPLDKTTFRPVEFDAIVVTFNTDAAGKVSGFSLKQGQNTTAYKRVEETKQPETKQP